MSDSLKTEIRRLNHVGLVQREYIRIIEWQLKIDIDKVQRETIMNDLSIGYIEAANRLAMLAESLGE